MAEKKKYEKRRYPPRKRKTPDGKPRQCTAINKLNGKRCGNVAVNGRTTCRMHGGHSTNVDKVTHGRYSKYKVELFDDIIAKLNFEPGKEHDLVDELKIMRTVLYAILNSCKDEFDIVEKAPLIGDYIKDLSKIIQRVERMRSGYRVQIGLVHVEQISAQIIDAINEEVKNDTVRARLAKRIKEIKVYGV